MKHERVYKHHSELGITAGQREAMILLMGRLERGEVEDYWQGSWSHCIAGQLGWFLTVVPQLGELESCPVGVERLFCGGDGATQQQGALALHHLLMGSTQPWVDTGAELPTMGLAAPTREDGILRMFEELISTLAHDLRGPIDA